MEVMINIEQTKNKPAFSFSKFPKLYNNMTFVSRPGQDGQLHLMSFIL